MCQRLNTGESNNYYFGIFICIGPLNHKYVLLFAHQISLMERRPLLLVVGLWLLGADAEIGS